MIRRRRLLVGSGTLLAPFIAGAQTAGNRIYRVGYLGYAATNTPEDDRVWAAFVRRPRVFAPYRGFGATFSYGPDCADTYRKAAKYVAKILSGARAGDVPMEQPTKFELVIDLKMAKALAITILRSLLLRADEVIE